MLFMPLLLSSFAGFALADTLISDVLSSTIAASLYAANVTGVQVAVVRNESTQLKAWGNKTETGEPLTPDTLMNIGSCSKAFLSAAMSILMDDFEQRKNLTSLPDGVDTFTWTTKVAALLPEWKLMDEWANEKADIQDLLSHVTGVSRHDFSYSSSDSVVNITSRLRYLEPANELRQNWSYNNQMYMVGSYIIEKYSGTSFTSFVENRIMRPTGMTQSTYSPSVAAQSGNLSESFNAANRRIPQWITNESAPMIAGPGGVLSSAADMLNWVEMLLNKGVVPKSNETVIPLSAYTAVIKPYAAVLGIIPPVSYGMGWLVATYKGHEVILHDGAIAGGSSYVVLLPADGIAVVVLVNGSDKSELVDTVWSSIVDSLLGITNNSTRSFVAPVKRDLFSKPDSELPASNHFRRDQNVSLDSFAGTYYNPGYGANFTLCTSTPSPKSSICARTISDFTAVDGIEKFNATTGISLYATWPRFWSSHLRFVAFNESSLDASGAEGAGVFTVEAASLFPTGYGADQSPFEDSFAQTIAQFGVDGDSGRFGVRVAGLSGAGLQSSVLFERL